MVDVEVSFDPPSNFTISEHGLVIRQLTAVSRSTWAQGA